MDNTDHPPGFLTEIASWLAFAAFVVSVWKLREALDRPHRER
jgi:hypothetical protein